IGAGVCEICSQKFPLNISSINKKMEIIDNDAIAHSEPYGDAKTTKYFDNGDIVTIQAQTYNAFNNLWYKTSSGDWIVSGYLEDYKEVERPRHTVHEYVGAGVCAICNKEFQLSITPISKRMEVISNDAITHTEPYGDAEINRHLVKGDTVTLKSQTRNAFDNLWYKTATGDWIVSGYLKI
ncbi:MAG: hypothetical protein LBU94_01360, partial [Clostridiales bacterium]|nr:hypothetical protein [Clostridiales bacterium]